MLILNLKEDDKVVVDQKEIKLFSLLDYSFHISITDSQYSKVLRYVVKKNEQVIDSMNYNLNTESDNVLKVKELVFYYHNFLKAIKKFLEDNGKYNNSLLKNIIQGFISSNLLVSNNFSFRKIADYLLIILRDSDKKDKIISYSIKDGVLNTLYEVNYDIDSKFDEGKLIKQALELEVLEDDIALALI